MANTLAYYDTATIAAVKSFIVQAPDCTKLAEEQKYLVSNFLFSFPISETQVVRRIGILKNTLELLKIIFRFEVAYHVCNEDSLFVIQGAYSQ